ncbi:hypothetical protein D3C74_160150 [compost metagenome]
MRFVGIDPATNTGVVILDADGNPILETVIRGKGRTQPGGISLEQRVSLQNQLYRLLQSGDVVIKEAIAHGTPRLITSSKIHGGLEDMITRKGLRFDEVAPAAVKKFVRAKNHKIVDGVKRKLTSEKEKKGAMAEAALEHFNYSNPSHDVVDAYIIAQIGMAVHQVRSGEKTLEDFKLIYQREVIWSIIDPDGYKEYVDKPKSNKRRGKPAATDSHTQNTEQTCLF